VAGLLRGGRVRHALLAVESGNRTFRWTGVAGAADPAGSPMCEATPYFIASVDKLLTATVVLRLHERGRLDVDGPMSEYLPESLIHELHRFGGRDHTGDLTIRHLLAHASGLADYLEDRPGRGASLVESLVARGDRSWSVEDAARLIRGGLDAHFVPQPMQAPRQRIRYSDSNYLLLRAIVERATDEPIHRVFDNEIFGPLDLRHTWMPGRSLPRDPTPSPATLWFDDRPIEIPMAMASLGAVCSTAQDQLTFLRALVRGELFDSAGTWQAMQQRWNRFGLPLDAAARRAPAGRSNTPSASCASGCRQSSPACAACRRSSDIPARPEPGSSTAPSWTC
jgi:D-alanyl-D-alanine carboxypeptidase